MLQAKGSKASLHVGEDAWQTQTIDTAQSLADFLQVAKSSCAPVSVRRRNRVSRMGVPKQSLGTRSTRSVQGPVILSLGKAFCNSSLPFFVTPVQ